MWCRRNWYLSLKVLAHLTLFLFTTSCSAGELSETESNFFNFIRAIDPQNILRIRWNGIVPHPCSYRWKGTVKCNFEGTSSSSSRVTQIRLDNQNFTGAIDADSLCKLHHLQVLSLAKNLIQGNIPRSILNCKSLTYLNLSSNLLRGRVPVVALIKLKHLRTLDISNNYLTGIFIPHSELDKYSTKRSTVRILYKLQKLSRSVADSNYSSTSDAGSVEAHDPADPPKGSKRSASGKKEWYVDKAIYVVPLVFVIALAAYFVNKIKFSDSAKEREIDLMKSLAQIYSPQKSSPQQDLKPKERWPELVFFVEERERFRLDELFEATAELQSQTPNSSLYKVKLEKNNIVYAVKRLKKLQVSFEEFGQTMRQIGNLKHPNILPLVGYNSTDEEKLVIYKYQSNGSLLKLLEDYNEGKREFPWKLRLSIATGIARGLDFIYRNPIDHEIIPHGNVKLSNILLDENEEALISEYGLFSRLLTLDPTNKRAKYRSFSSINNNNDDDDDDGYTAPDQKTLSEQGDVFSFGIIVLELLTGKTAEKSGIDLPKWVRSIVREEWTGEVFDKEAASCQYYAFPLLNLSLKCVSNSAQERPSMGEVMEKIEEVVNAYHDQDDFISTISSSMAASIVSSSSPPECCFLHSLIPDTWDTPASNY